jgi:DNA replication protein DnaC
MSTTATLPLLLKQLRLPSLYAHWKDYAKQAEKSNWDHATYLSKLIELEVNSRYQSRIHRYTKESHLIAGKSLATFELGAIDKKQAAQIQALSDDVGWVQQAENLILFGPSGVGKTHIASAIGHAMISQGVRVLFTSTTSLVQQLQLSKKSYQLQEVLDKLDRFRLLILDDIGYVKKDEAETSVLFELIANRYENGSLLITANQPFSEWDKIFPDNMMAVAAIDRLVHHARILNIEVESYRKAGANKERSK